MTDRKGTDTMTHITQLLTHRNVRQVAQTQVPHRQRGDGQVQLLHQANVQHGPDTILRRLLQQLLDERVRASASPELSCLRPMRVAGQAEHLMQKCGDTHVRSER